MTMVQKTARSLALGCGLPLLLAFSPAQAAPIEFDFAFTHGDGTVEAQASGPVNYAGSVAGTSMAATAYARTNTGNWVTTLSSTAVVVSHFDSATDGDGIGVQRPNNSGSTSAIDSTSTFVEGILFDFGSLKLTSATVFFGGVDAWDDVIVQWGNGPFNATGASPQLANSSLSKVISTNGTLTGAFAREYQMTFDNLGGVQYLFIQAPNDGVTGTNCNTIGVNCFRVNGIEASSVPEPSAIALLGLGIVGLGLSRRRKTR